MPETVADLVRQGGRFAPRHRPICSEKRINRAANKSTKTLEWYDTGISRYEQYLLDQLDREPTLADNTLLAVWAFIVALQERKPRPLSCETINSYVRALRAFTHFIYDEGLSPSWLLEKLKPPKVELKLKDIVEPEDIKRIFATFNPQTFLGSRKIAMIALFLDGGLRLSELTGLKMEDRNFLQGYVRVMGKGRKERIIGISDEAIQAIQRYLFVQNNNHSFVCQVECGRLGERGTSTRIGH